MLVSGGWDYNIKIWDIRQPNPVKSITRPLICGDSIDLSTGFLLTGACMDTRQLQLWDYSSGELLKDIDWDDGLPSERACLVYEARFHEMNMIIAGGAGSNEIKLFDVNDNFKPCA